MEGGVPPGNACVHQDALPAMHLIRIEHHRPVIQTSKADDRDLMTGVLARTDKRLKAARTKSAHGKRLGDSTWDHLLFLLPRLTRQNVVT